MKKVILLLLIAIFIISCSSSNEPEQRKPKTSIEISKTQPDAIIPMAVGNWWEYDTPQGKIKYVVDAHYGDIYWEEHKRNYDTWVVNKIDNYHPMPIPLAYGFSDNEEFIIGNTSTYTGTCYNKKKINYYDCVFVSEEIVQTNLGIVNNCYKYKQEDSKWLSYYKKGFGLILETDGFDFNSSKLIDYEIK